MQGWLPERNIGTQCCLKRQDATPVTFEGEKNSVKERRVRIAKEMCSAIAGGNNSTTCWGEKKERKEKYSWVDSLRKALDKIAGALVQSGIIKIKDEALKI